MTEVIAKSTFIRQSPRKMRLVADQIRGIKANEAEVVLKNLNKRAASLFLPVLKQGIGNAVNNFGLKKEGLRIKKLEVGGGPRHRRWRFVARGRVHPILKRTSHITLVLEGEATTKKETKKTRAEKTSRRRSKSRSQKKKE